MRKKSVTLYEEEVQVLEKVFLWMENNSEMLGLSDSEWALEQGAVTRIIDERDYVEHYDREELCRDFELYRENGFGTIDEYLDDSESFGDNEISEEDIVWLREKYR